jgi:hypothetical protein
MAHRTQQVTEDKYRQQKLHSRFAYKDVIQYVRFQVLTAASMMFRAVFWVVLPCKMIMMEAVRTSETSVDNHFTWHYNPEDSSEHHVIQYVVILLK